MEVSEFIEAVESALESGTGRRPLELTVREVMGQRGRYQGRAPSGASIYGYTRRQCRAMRAIIAEAAREDAITMDDYEPEAIRAGDLTTSPEDSPE